MSAEAELQSDTGDTTLNESSSFEIEVDEAQPAMESNSPTIESMEPSAPKIASLVQQVILLTDLIH